jgi:hypothetical protein
MAEETGVAKPYSDEDKIRLFLGRTLASLR